MSTKDPNYIEKYLDNPIIQKEELLLLGHVRLYLDDETNWNPHGLKSVDPDTGKMKLCIQGALEMFVDESDFTIPAKRMAEELLRTACHQRGYQSFNDTHNHTEVMEIVTTALALGSSGLITLPPVKMSRYEREQERERLIEAVRLRNEKEGGE